MPPVEEKQNPRSIGELVAGISERFSRLIRDEIELAKVQAAAKAQKLGVGAGLLAAAGVLALYAFGILLLAAVWGIANALPLWLSALIVGFVLLLICAILALVGIKSIKKSNEYVVDPKSGLINDIEAAKKGLATDE
ncbi:phage holin family protein [Flaviflexus salsibiostraticola]|uniref:Phage holin family protein n=1 Tax=Flaviflexus salsibiostraticola TaxID=1282737 RepID=A0A3S8ZC94_9ACTO|nr:phage holin family protein [Flaviflexus salsibiostraticola]